MPLGARPNKDGRGRPIAHSEVVWRQASRMLGHEPNPPKGKKPIFMWDADQEEHVDYDESKWDEFCERCAAAKGAECVCKTCPET